LEMLRAQDLDRQPFNQKFPLDLTRRDVMGTTAHFIDSTVSLENAKELNWSKNWWEWMATVVPRRQDPVAKLSTFMTTSLSSKRTWVEASN
jgi:hypothetical protein